MSARSKAPTIARILLGLTFTVFGLNFFLNFLPQPAPPPEAGAFLGALYAGKILAVVKTLEVATGILLLTNRFVPLSLALLAPIEVGIVLFHGVYEPSGLPLALFVVALTAYLAYAYRAAFAPMLRPHVEPTPAAHVAPAGQPATA